MAFQELPSQECFRPFSFSRYPDDGPCGPPELFLHDRQTNETSELNIPRAGQSANGSGLLEDLSGNGRFVAFASYRDTVASGDANCARDVFVYDRGADVTERVSQEPSSCAGEAVESGNASLSADGRYVAFSSVSPNLVPGDTNGAEDVFVYDRQTNSTERVSLGAGSAQGGGASLTHEHTGGRDISADGRYVVFTSSAANLAESDTNGIADLFVRDRQLGTTRLISAASDGAGANGPELPDRGLEASISADGAAVSFASDASNLVEDDGNAKRDVFLRHAGPDVTPPTLTLPATITTTATDSSGAAVTFNVSASDVDDPSPQVSCDPGSGTVFPVGTNVVSCQARDSAGNAASRSFRIFVRDQSGGGTQANEAALEVRPVYPLEADMGTPFLVTAYVRNRGSVTATAPRVALRLPRGLVVDGSATRTLAGPLPPHSGERRVSWRVTAVSGAAGRKRLIVRASAAPRLFADPVTLSLAVFRRAGAAAPRPLLAAHGLNADSASMQYSSDLARTLVPDLPASRVRGDDLDRYGSVFENGDELARIAGEMISGSPFRSVNVIAHSKGGLDARWAMWSHPERFSALGMLATPNGGSHFAEYLCTFENPGDRPFGLKALGPCSDLSDGLWDTRADFVQAYFNRIVRDYRHHRLYVAAGDCTQALANPFCSLRSSLASCENGGDDTVCVESAWYLSRRGYRYPGSGAGRGQHIPLGPTTDSNHTDIRTTPCPVSRVLGALYGRFNEGNPWVDPEISGPGTVPARTRCRSLEPAVAAASTASPPPLVDQRSQSLVIKPGAPASIMVDPEGGERLGVSVYLPEGVNPTITVVGAAPQPPIETSDVLGQQLRRIQLEGLGGSRATLSIAVDAPAEVLVTTAIDSAVTAAATLTTPGGAGTPTVVRVQFANLPQNLAATYRGTARAKTPSGIRTFNLTAPAGACQVGPTCVLTGSAVLPAGSLVPVDISIEGTNQRLLTESVVIPAGGGTIGAASTSSLLDTDSDGRVDELRANVPVTVSAGGEYQLAVDLHGPTGSLATSANGEATLSAGAGSITVRVPVESLLAAGAGGPYSLRNVVLSRGATEPALIVTAATAGSTGPVDLQGLIPAAPVVSDPVPSVHDDSLDGRYDRLRFSGSVSVPETGEYLIEAQLAGPDGTVVSYHSPEVPSTFLAGPNPFVIDFDGAVVGGAGSGVYVLQGITVMRVTNPALYAEGTSVATEPLDSSQWALPTPTIGALIARWEQARAAGEIGDVGFYATQLVKLRLIQAKVLAGSNASARDDLDAFITVLEQEESAIQAGAAARIGDYAAQVRASLG